MEENNYDKINSLVKEKGMITSKEIKKQAIHSWFLTDYVRKNNLIKVAPGIYVSKNIYIDDYFIFQYRYPKFIFSGLSALYLHNLTDVNPLSIYVSSMQGYNPPSKSNIKVIIKRYSNKKLYSIGITDVTTRQGNIVKVYDINRSICDLIKYRDHYDGETFIKAIKRYVSNPSKDVVKLFEYAKLLGIEKKVYEIMEVINNED